LPGPALWFGGKSNWQLPHILRVLPRTPVFVEPYGGAGSVILSKEPVEVEVYNELDERLVNLMNAIKDPVRFHKLYHRAYFSLYSREEFVKALDIMANSNDEDDKAYAFFILQNQGYGGISTLPGHWGRAFTSDKSVAKKVRTFYLRVDRIPRQHERLQNINIYEKDALDIIAAYDSIHTCMYLDPPYTPKSRVNKKVYKVDQDAEHHKKLVKLILNCDSAIILSGYKDELYNPLEKAGWDKIERNTAASSSARNRGMKTLGTGSLLKHVPRTEVVWRNQRAVQLLKDQAE